MVTTTPTAQIARPATITAATAALVLSALADLTNVGGYLSGAPIPPAILGIEVILGVASLVAAGGLWGRQRWATPLSLALAVLNVLLGLMGIFTAGSTTGKVVAATGAVMGLIVLALVVPLATRRAAR
jgi:hypothetical protein